MAEIHDLINRLGQEEARLAIPTEMTAGLKPRSKQMILAQADWSRRIDWAADILDREQLRRNWLHSGFCLTALPHTKPTDDSKAQSLRNGDFALILTPKPIDADEEGGAIYAGLPYGPKARLILVYIQTFAIRNQTRRIVLGDNMTSWIRKLGFNNITGGDRGVITAVNEQARRISRTEFTMIWDKDRRRILTDQALVTGLDLFAEQDTEEAPPAQLSFLSGVDHPTEPSRRRRRYKWVREIELADAFYQHLRDHKVVLAEEAIAKLKGSSWALDVYLWLSYRLRSVDRRTPTISWEQLRLQFSPRAYQNNTHVFRSKIFEPALRDVQAVYPGANFEISDRGLTLLPSALPIPSNQHQILMPVPVAPEPGTQSPYGPIISNRQSRERDSANDRVAEEAIKCIRARRAKP
jgi:hypothetical protein